MTFTEFLTTLRQADEQATKGPWVAEGLPHQQAIYHPHSAEERQALKTGYEGEHVVLGGQSYLDEDDAHSIALLRNTLAQTIAIMEVARKALEAGAKVESLKADLTASLRLEKELREEGHRYLGPPDPKSGVSETPESKDWRKRLRKADLETRRLTIELQAAHEALPRITAHALASIDALAAKTP